jgi:copper chaperone
MGTQVSEGGIAMAEQTYVVTGMTCGHCVGSVSSEVGAVVGVESVAVDLASGRVTVTGAGYSDEQIRAAVDEAGYQLASA